MKQGKLNISNLTFSYGRKKQDVLSDFSLSLESGGVYGLLGPNGAGKSTLLYLICGALTPKSGNVTYDGMDTRARRASTLQNIFIVLEEMSLPHVNLEEYVKLMSPFYPDFDREIMDKALSIFNLDCSEEHLDSLSMGQKKKVYVSFALACRTPLLLMDEPTNGLDIPGKTAFRRLCAELMDDKRIIIISTHQVRDLDNMLDHLLILNENRLCFKGSMADIQRKLHFSRGVGRDQAENALASILAPGGYDIMEPAANEEDESMVNLELLFAYAMSDPDSLNSIVNGKTEES